MPASTQQQSLIAPQRIQYPLPKYMAQNNTRFKTPSANTMRMCRNSTPATLLNAPSSNKSTQLSMMSTSPTSSTQTQTSSPEHSQQSSIPCLHHTETSRNNPWHRKIIRRKHHVRPHQAHRHHLPQRQRVCPHGRSFRRLSNRHATNLHRPNYYHKRQHICQRHQKMALQTRRRKIMDELQVPLHNRPTRN